MVMEEKNGRETRKMKNDAVNHPSHYTQYSVEVITITRYMTFDLGNVVKYTVRAPFKGNARQDFEKALFFARDSATLTAPEPDPRAVANAKVLASELPDRAARIVLAAVNGDTDIVIHELEKELHQ